MNITIHNLNITLHDSTQATKQLAPAPCQLHTVRSVHHEVLGRDTHRVPAKHRALLQHPSYQLALDLADLGIHPLDLSPLLQSRLFPQGNPWFTQPTKGLHIIYHASRNTVPPLGKSFLTSHAYVSSKTSPK